MGVDDNQRALALARAHIARRRSALERDRAELYQASAGGQMPPAECVRRQRVLDLWAENIAHGEALIEMWALSLEATAGLRP